MQITGAVIREQGVTFAVVLVKPHILHNKDTAHGVLSDLTPAFRLPVVLMTQSADGDASFFGRPDIARFLSRVSPPAIPWRRYTIN